MIIAPLVIVSIAVFFLHAAYSSHARLEAKRLRNVDLNCLATNVYHEARGEPFDGQIAVAEVTLNRLASPLFPDSVCAVVHEHRWDPERKRQVGMFSWTELDELPEPVGAAWEEAIAAAVAAYDGRHERQVGHALFYHADYVQPDWAASQSRVRQIGAHIFYE